MLCARVSLVIPSKQITKHHNASLNSAHYIELRLFTPQIKPEPPNRLEKADSLPKLGRRMYITKICEETKDIFRDKQYIFLSNLPKH